MKLEGLTQIRTEDSSFAAQVRELAERYKVGHELLDRGVQSLPKLSMRLPAALPEKFLPISLLHAGWIITPVLSTRLCSWGMNRWGRFLGRSYESLASNGKKTIPSWALDWGDPLVARILSQGLRRLP